MRAKILMVDDDAILRTAVAEELRAEGYNVVESVNADEARTILENNSQVILLFTDVRMPGTLDGIALARLVRIHYPNVKVVVASGHMIDREIVETFDGFFPKPYDTTALIAHIRALFPSLAS